MKKSILAGILLAVAALVFALAVAAQVHAKAIPADDNIPHSSEHVSNENLT